MRNLFSLIFVFVFSTAAGQKNSYTPFTDNENTGKEALYALTSRYEKDMATLSGSYKKYTAEVYKERFSLIKERLTEKEIITHPETQAYLSELANEIFQANPQMDKREVRIFFSRSFHANALSMGEGTILFNIGLFHRLKNESQAAFVLCHELAHYYLNHSNNNIHSYVSTVYSDDFQKKLKSIQKSGYGQNSQLEALAKNLMFKNRRHSREFEEAADSMALELLKNTKYDVREALTCLALLDSSDKDKYDHKRPFEKQFNFASFPFKKSWLESDELVFADTKTKGEKKEEDSLKTHPDCTIRIARLTDRVKEYTKQGAHAFVVDEKKFTALTTSFDYEIIEHCFNSKNVSRALFFTLQMLNEHPDDVYLNTMVGKCLNEFYTAQKTHQLSKLVDLPNRDQESKYNVLLNLIQNLRLREIAALSYHFLKQKEGQLSADAGFQQVFKVSKQNLNIQ